MCMRKSVIIKEGLKKIRINSKKDDDKIEMTGIDI